MWHNDRRAGRHLPAVALCGIGYGDCSGHSFPSKSGCLRKIVLILTLVALLDDIRFPLSDLWSSSHPSGPRRILGAGRMMAGAYGMFGCEGACEACVRRYGCMTPAWGQCCTQFYQHNGRKRAPSGDVDDVSMTSPLTSFFGDETWFDASSEAEEKLRSEPPSRNSLFRGEAGNEDKSKAEWNNTPRRNHRWRRSRARLAARLAEFKSPQRRLSLE